MKIEALDWLSSLIQRFKDLEDAISILSDENEALIDFLIFNDYDPVKILDDAGVNSDKN